MRTKFLGLAGKVSPHLVFCKGEAEMAKQIDDEVRAILTELSRFDGVTLPSGDPEAVKAH